ncbi:MAG: protein YgfX [Candidatus Accumulibacter sp. UW26]
MRCSRRLAWLMLLLHLLAAGCVWLLPWPAGVRYPLLALLAWSAWQTRQPSKVLGLRLNEDGEMAVRDLAGDWLPVTVEPGTAVFRPLIVLRLRSDDQGRRISLALLPDSMPAEQFRLLRLALRWLASRADRPAGGA